MQKKIFIVVVSLLVLLTGCKKGDTPTNVEPVKDPRTFQWSPDTIAYPESYQTLMTDIWGNSSSNVYAVGHNSQNRGVMWHYDGNKWDNIRLISDEGGQINASIELQAIYGFNGTDIYAVGTRIFGYNPNPPPTFLDSSLIIHFDGTSWKEEKIPRGQVMR